MRGNKIMILKPIQKIDKQNRIVTLRSADVSDGEALLQYLKITSGETPFLIREPDEIKLTLEQEEAFIRSKIKEPGELLLIGEIDGRQIGIVLLWAWGIFADMLTDVKLQLPCIRNTAVQESGK